MAAEEKKRLDELKRIERELAEGMAFSPSPRFQVFWKDTGGTCFQPCSQRSTVECGPCCCTAFGEAAAEHSLTPLC